MKMRIRTSHNQREALTMLRLRFGEAGYYIFSVVKWYRRHRLDFIAADKERPQRLLVIRPQKDGSISIRPFSRPEMYISTQKVLEEAQRYTPVPLRFSKRQLPFGRARPDWWLNFIPEKEREEFARLEAGMVSTAERLGLGKPSESTIH